ncbi:MAG TPA: hypothetical protein VF432_02900 [Thermoanaerobaculia bacterium]
MKTWKILFWNLRRLGLGTDDERKAAIQTVIKNTGAHYSFFCELTSAAAYPTPFLSKGLNPHQLCYGCVDDKAASVDLKQGQPLATPEFEAANFKGGTNFAKLANRGLGMLPLGGGATIYIIHAPAANSAARKVMSYLACWADAHHGAHNPYYLILGDFNIEPEDLEMTPADIDMTAHIVSTSEPTYIGRNEDKFYDYVLTDRHTNPNTFCDRLRKSPRLHGSDHYPIYVEWTVP